MAGNMEDMLMGMSDSSSSDGDSGDEEVEEVGAALSGSLVPASAAALAAAPAQPKPAAAPAPTPTPAPTAAAPAPVQRTRMGGKDLAAAKAARKPFQQQQQQQQQQTPAAPKPASAATATGPSQSEISRRLKSLYSPAGNARKPPPPQQQQQQAGAASTGSSSGGAATPSVQRTAPTITHEQQKSRSGGGGGGVGGSGQRQQQQQQSTAPSAGAATSRQTPDRATLQAAAKAKYEARREKFLMFTRLLMRYLETKDPDMHIRAKAVIKECAGKRDKHGESSVTANMQTRLKEVVGDAYWKKASDYLAHFLKKKQIEAQRERERGGGSGSGAGSGSGSTAVSSVAAQAAARAAAAAAAAVKQQPASGGGNPQEQQEDQQPPPPSQPQAGKDAAKREAAAAAAKKEQAKAGRKAKAEEAKRRREAARAEKAKKGGQQQQQNQAQRDTAAIKAREAALMAAGAGGAATAAALADAARASGLTFPSAADITAAANQLAASGSGASNGAAGGTVAAAAKKKKASSKKAAAVRTVEPPPREYADLMEMLDHAVRYDQPSAAILLSPEFKADVDLGAEQRRLLYGDGGLLGKAGADATMPAAPATGVAGAPPPSASTLPAAFKGWSKRNVVSARTAWARVRLLENKSSIVELSGGRRIPLPGEKPPQPAPIPDEYDWINEDRAEEDRALALLSEAAETYLKTLLEGAVAGARQRQNLDGVRLWHQQHGSRTKPPLCLRLGCDVRRQVALSAGNAAMTVKRMEEALARGEVPPEHENNLDSNETLYRAVSMSDLAKRPRMASAASKADYDAKRSFEEYGGKGSGAPPLGRVPKKAKITVRDFRTCLEDPAFPMQRRGALASAFI